MVRIVGSVVDVDVQIVWLAVTRGEGLSERGCGSATRGRKVCLCLTCVEETWF